MSDDVPSFGEYMVDGIAKGFMVVIATIMIFVVTVNSIVFLYNKIGLIPTVLICSIVATIGIFSYYIISNIEECD